MSNKNVKYINFKYIILAPPKNLNQDPSPVTRWKCGR